MSRTPASSGDWSDTELTFQEHQQQQQRQAASSGTPGDQHSSLPARLELEASQAAEQPLPSPWAARTFASSAASGSAQPSTPVSVSKPGFTLQAAQPALQRASLPVSIATGTRRQPHLAASPSQGLLGGDKFMPPHQLLAQTLPQECNLWGEPMTFKPGSSVVEGRGRKLQGQAQIRLRQAIMRQTGFLEEDANEAQDLPSRKRQAEHEASLVTVP